MTAWHCEYPYGGIWRTHYGSRPVAIAQGNDKEADTETLAPQGGSFGPYIFTGGVDQTGGGGSQEKVQHVSGANYPHDGELICLSGSFSGEQCSVKIVNSAYSINGSGNFFIQGEQVNHYGAAGNGDSGGPAYRYPDSTDVTAKGMINYSDGNNQVPCRGVPTQSWRICSWRVWMSPIMRLLTVQNAQIMTSY